MNDETYTKMERLKIILDITTKLKNFPMSSGTGTWDLYNLESYTMHEFKKIFKNYITQNEPLQSYEGSIHFDEINRTIEYILPVKKSIDPVFVLRYI